MAVRNNETIDKIEYIGKSKSPQDYDAFKKYLYEFDSYCFPGIFICRIDHFDKCINDRNIYKYFFIFTKIHLILFHYIV